jgi:rubredoxin
MQCNECDWNGDEDELVDQQGMTSSNNDCDLDNAVFCPKCGYRIPKQSSDVPKNNVEAFDLDIESDPDIDENFDSLGQD